MNRVCFYENHGKKPQKSNYKRIDGIESEPDAFLLWLEPSRFYR